jgi:hypothetical protein
MATADPSQNIETAAIEDSSLLAFYRDMNLSERRTFWACAAGWAPRQGVQVNGHQGLGSGGGIQDPKRRVFVGV